MSTDRNYLGFLGVLIRSIFASLRNDGSMGTSDDEICFHILVDESVDQNEGKIQLDTVYKDFSNKIKATFCFHLVDRSLFESASCLDPTQRLPNDSNQEPVVSYAPYYRLLVADFVDSSVESVLYLDIDMLVYDDIRGVFKEHDLKDTVVYAQHDHCFMTTPYILERSTGQKKYMDIERYFNTGLILFNIPLWRELQMKEKCLKLIPHYDLVFADQEVLNFVCQNEKFPSDIAPVKYFSLRDNVFDGYFIVDYKRNDGAISQPFDTVKSRTVPFKFNEMFDAISNPRIYHFTWQKPWRSVSYLPSHSEEMFITSIRKWIFHAEYVPFCKLQVVLPSSYAHFLSNYLEDARKYSKRKVKEKFVYTLVLFVITWIILVVGLIF